MPPCDLLRVTTEGFALSVPLGDRDLPRGALVRQVGDEIEVVSAAGWYALPSPARPGDRGRAPVSPLGDHLVVSTITGDLVGCDATHARAVAPAIHAEVQRVRAVYRELFGADVLVPWTDWGRVGLPLPTAVDVAAEWAREGLLTPLQREKAVAAEGPAWAHFWGADPPMSDVWAEPDAVVALMRLAHAWRGPPLQIGDLSWYNAARPDPLGHRDHDGSCVDLRLFRTDGSRYEAWWNRPDERTGVRAYDAATTIAFLRFAFANAALGDVYFNDPAAAMPGVEALPGHDDHLHLCFA